MSVLLAAATCVAEGKRLYALPVGGFVPAVVARQAVRRTAAVRRDAATAEARATPLPRRFTPRLANITC